MKKLLFALLVLLVSTTTLSAEERVIDYRTLPQSALTFISTHFPTDNVSIATVEKDLLNRDYKVILTSGAKLEFDKRGDWTSVEVKGKSSSVPEVIIPANIAQYVKSQFPSNRVVKIELDKRTTDIDLNNDIELKFNKEGILVEFDN